MNPRIIMAQVEGSGTAATEPNSISGILKVELESKEVNVAEVNGVDDVMPKNPKVDVS